MRMNYIGRQKNKPVWPPFYQISFFYNTCVMIKKIFMNARHSFHYPIIWLWLCLGAVTIGLFLTPLWAKTIGLVGLIGWLWSGAILIRRPWSGLGIFSSFIIVHVLVYSLYKSTPVSLFGTIVFLTLVLLIIKKFKPSILSQSCPPASLPVSRFSPTNSVRQKIEFFLIGLTIFFQLLLLFVISAQATTDALPSPWLMFPWYFFLLYAATTALLYLCQYYIKQTRVGLFLIIFHFIVSFHIAVLVYPLGYGYDPFLHRASENHIFTTGVIEPKTPFYIGQYAIINLLAQATPIPLFWLDVLLTPLSASILLPLAAWFGLRFGFKLSDRRARLGAILLLIYPLSTMFATTPYNLATVFLLTIILLSPAVSVKRLSLFLLTLTALAALMIHVLSGIFALWFVLGIFIANWKKHSPEYKKSIVGVFIIYGLIGFFLTPFLFTIFQHSQGIRPQPLQTLFDERQKFFSYFQEPYYFIKKAVPLRYDIIYIYRKLIPILIVVIALIGFVKKKPSSFKLLYPLLALTLLGNVFFLSTWVVFPELHQYEQLQYGGRLFYLIPFFLLPLFLFGLQTLEYKLISQRPAWLIPILGLVGLLLTGSLYLLYPQKNPKVYFRGYNVSAADKQAAEFIYSNTPSSTRYIVLSSNITAAAAISQYGFSTYYDTSAGKIFYYSIPTGGPLYTQYLNLLYEGQKLEYVETAMAVAKAERAYVVIPAYWDKAEQIIAGLQSIADSSHSIQEGKMWVFMFDKHVNIET